MRRFFRALSGALIATSVCLFVLDFGGAHVRAAHAEETKPNANDCMSFQNDVQEKSIAVHASNVCDRHLSCTLSYAVRCEDHAGKVTASSNASARFTLKPHADTEVTMSAEQCQQGWNIDGVSWVCS